MKSAATRYSPKCWPPQAGMYDVAWRRLAPWPAAWWLRQAPHVSVPLQQIEDGVKLVGFGEPASVDGAERLPLGEAFGCGAFDPGQGGLGVAGHGVGARGVEAARACAAK